MLLIKKLEKKMTYKEALSYIKKHPRYRLLSKDEAIAYNKNTWYEDDNNVHALFKLNIYVTPRLENTTIGIVFYISARLSEPTGTVLNKLEAIVTGVYDDIVEAMTENDLIYIKE